MIGAVGMGRIFWAMFVLSSNTTMLFPGAQQQQHPWEWSDEEIKANLSPSKGGMVMAASHNDYDQTHTGVGAGVLPLSNQNQSGTSIDAAHRTSNVSSPAIGSTPRHEDAMSTRIDQERDAASLREDQSSMMGEPKRIAVFFNTYKPLNMTPPSMSRASRIIQSQLRIIRDQPLLRNSTMYYTRFGDYESPPLDFDEYCSSPTPPTDHHQNTTTSTGSTESSKNSHRQRRMRCVEIAAQQRGGEEITLQAMHEYCTDRPADHVVYLHSKGTHTMTPRNDQLRDLLMKAIFSDECLSLGDPTTATMVGCDDAAVNTATDDRGNNSSSSSSSSSSSGTHHPKKGLLPHHHHHHGCRCDACSYKFAMWPAPHYPGNMYVAPCEYIRRLIPPNKFSVKKRALARRLKQSIVAVDHSERFRGQPTVTVTVRRSRGKTTTTTSSPESSSAGNDKTAVKNASTGTGISAASSDEMKSVVQFEFLQSHNLQLYKPSWLGSK
jgi:hypothetical protein